MESEYSGTDIGIVLGFALVGLGTLLVGMTLVLASEFAVSDTAGQWLAFGALLVFASGIFSFVTSRTVVSLLRGLEDRLVQLRA